MELKLNETLVEEGKGKDWYMSSSYDSQGVTSASSNPELGILKMTVKAPSAEAKKARVVAQLEIETQAGWLNASVFHAKEDASNLYIAVDSRKGTGENQDKYYESIRLKVATKAQILRHVRSLCGEVEAQPVAQAQAQTQAGIDPAMFAQFQAFMAMQQQQQGAVQASAPAQPTVPGIIGQGGNVF